MTAASELRQEDYPLTVRRPAGRPIVASVIGETPQLTPVGVHDIDLETAVPVGGESNLASTTEGCGRGGGSRCDLTGTEHEQRQCDGTSSPDSPLDTALHSCPKPGSLIRVASHRVKSSDLRILLSNRVARARCWQPSHQNGTQVRFRWLPCVLGRRTALSWVVIVSILYQRQYLNDCLVLWSP